MKKLLLAILFVGSASATCLAQANQGSKFNIGVEAGLPVGSTHDLYNSVIGGSIKYELSVASSTFLTLSAGYNSFHSTDDYQAVGAKSSVGFVPLKAGLKYYFNEGFFGEGQLGVAINTVKDGGSAFAYSPGIGYSFDGGLEAGVRYEGWSKGGTISQVGLRVGYRF
ncbi:MULTISPECIES: hypothetical protein [unclassified Mucilaginibacter]|uniref:outer membrane beta-barrel protein n=1 Tax=unclassified Mucilaginibacter TaxID=2617802 RepID=UPI00138C6C97|nr:MULTISPECIES: hypothetical protein [unclassified Mucilaginibacter]MBB5397565.1 hypothetical protein [Mucilaginibacter sp. AK015]QHS57788.1 hypothetical protein GWR56_20375 [Mucilaginibacter sp. 14171R-50]